jgi:hypothetical protein
MYGMKMKIKILLTLLFIFSSIPTICHLKNNKSLFAANDQYLRIVIVNYINQGKPESEYLSLSLTEAVDTSMQKKFKYIRIKPKKISQEIIRLQKKGYFQKGKSLIRRELLELSVSTFADVIIYGSYKNKHDVALNKLSSPKKGKTSIQAIGNNKKISIIEISTKIYFVNDNKTIHISKIRNKINSTLFDAINKVASQVIKEFEKVKDKTDLTMLTDSTILAELNENNVAVLTWLPIYIHKKEIVEEPVIYNVLTKPFTETINQKIASTFDIRQTTEVVVNDYMKKNKGFIKKSKGKWSYETSDLIKLSEKFDSDYIFFGHILTEDKNEVEEIKYTLELKLFQVSIGKIISEFSKTGFTVAEIQSEAEDISSSIIETFKKIKFPVSVKVVGLKSKSVELLVNDKNMIIEKNGINEFSDKLFPLDDYFVKIKKNPLSPLQTCHLRKANGEIKLKAVNNISLICLTNTYSITGQIHGLKGDNVNISLNDQEEISITKNGIFKFKRQIEDMESYLINIEKQPMNPRQNNKFH